MKRSILLLSILMLFASCFQQNSSMDQTRGVALFFAKPGDIDVAVATCQVSGDDMDTIRVALTVSSTEITGTVPEVPYGDDRLFEIFCYTSAGIMNYYGSAEADINSLAPLVNIILYPYNNTADVTIIGTFGDPETNLDLGLIAHYSFDQNVQDKSTSENHCYDLTDSLYVDGINGKAKYFDGENDMLQISKSLDASEGLTFSFWLYSEGVISGQENGVIISKYNKDNGGRCFIVNTQASYTQNNPSLRGNFYYLGSTNMYRDCAYSDIMTMDDIPVGDDSLLYDLNEPMKLPLNEWTHCVINVTETEVQAWINGILCVSRTREYSEYGTGTYTDTLIPSYIGNCPALGYGDNNHYHGAIDELRIYDRSLTDSEIAFLYNSQQ